MRSSRETARGGEQTVTFPRRLLYAIIVHHMLVYKDCVAKATSRARTTMRVRLLLLPMMVIEKYVSAKYVRVY